MTRRFTIVLVTAVVATGSVGPINAAPPYATPRTGWGDPDLQGVWSYNDDVNTPFERPSELGTKAEFGARAEEKAGRQ